jgi:hypothetical protein
MRTARWQVNDKNDGLGLVIDLGHEHEVRLTISANGDYVPSVDLVKWGCLGNSFNEEDRASFRQWLDEALGIDLAAERSSRANEYAWF